MNLLLAMLEQISCIADSFESFYRTLFVPQKTCVKNRWFSDESHATRVSGTLFAKTRGTRNHPGRSERALVGSKSLPEIGRLMVHPKFVHAARPIGQKRRVDY